MTFEYGVIYRLDGISLVYWLGTDAYGRECFGNVGNSYKTVLGPQSLIDRVCSFQEMI